MTDIVERLRTFGAWEKVVQRHKLVHEAADEIERLRERLHLRAALRAIVERSEQFTGGIEHDAHPSAGAADMAEIERLRRGGCARDQTLTQFCAVAHGLALKNERLRAALRDLIDAIDCSPSRLPPGAGPQEIGAQYRAMVYRVSGHHVEKAREALGDE